MRKYIFMLSLLFVALLWSAPATLAQTTTAQRGPDASTVRDAQLETDSLANLDRARFYFKLRKAYVASLKRCEEVIASNPNFARMDEVLYIAGASSVRLAENKGKQKTQVPVEKLREDARGYLLRLVNEYPESSFRDEAEKELRALGVENPRAGK